MRTTALILLLAQYLLYGVTGASEPRQAAFALTPGQAGSPAANALSVSIFGDGNPANGAEDNRIPIDSPEIGSLSFSIWALGAGTLHCDGLLRGSAMILDLTGFGSQPPGLVLLTAAHVLFDLERERLFRACSFHYMGLSNIPVYQAAIDLSSARLGGFDPRQPRDQPSFGRGDWALLHVADPASAALREAGIKPAVFDSEAYRAPEGWSYHLIAWSEQNKGISVSVDCQVRESAAGDLGGGSWPGQLLDDCDSGLGASGGGLIVVNGGYRYLVGIRTGAHWDESVFPLPDYPAGPPAGARWDIHTNTNFGRALDVQIMEELKRFVRALAERFPA